MKIVDKGFVIGITIVVVLWLGILLLMPEKENEKLYSFCLKNVSFHYFVERIENDTQYSFLYSEDCIDRINLITVDVTNVPIGRVIYTALRQSSVGFKVSGNRIIIFQQ